jgi:hypothetical protein
MARSKFLFAVILVGGVLSDVIASSASAHVNRGDVESSRGPITQLAVVSEDPYTNPGTYHRTQVEPDSLAFGSTIVIVFQTGRSYRCGASNIGWSVSHDAGSTWTEGFLPSTTIHSTPSGEWKRGTDPVVAYDAKHNTWLAQGLGLPSCPFSGGDVFVSRSTDDAWTFGEPVIIQRQKRTQLFDKPWIACDNTPTSPFYGHCYAEWDDEGHHLRLHMSTSTDGGLTWNTSTVRKDTRVIGGQPLVQPDGTVVMVTPQCCPTRIDSFVSTDGGSSYAGHGTQYSGPLALRDVRASRIQGGLRYLTEPPFISADLDAVGKIYVVWTDCRFRDFGPGQHCAHNDIVMSTTTDGRHWSSIVRIPIDPRTSSVDHFLPAIAVDPTTSGASAHLALVYYFYPEADCTRSTCELSVGFASSTDGGTTWTAQQLAGPFRTKWLPLTSTGYMIGDYFSVSFVDGQAIPVFIAATKGTCELGDIVSCNVWTASATIPLGSGS